MVVDDIVVCGAAPLFMTDYIACGRVVPERVAAIVRGIAEACALTRTALVGGETAEHPDLIADDDYDVAGAAVGVVEADRLLGADRVRDGDAVLAMASSGLHSNGFSLVRRVLRDAGLAPTAEVPEFGGPIGLALLEPTRLYTAPLLDVLDSVDGAGVHALSHVTGGGIAANLARVLPRDARVELDRASWTPPAVFRTLADLGGFPVGDTEGTWNLGIGMIAVVDPAAEDGITAQLAAAGVPNWRASTVRTGAGAPEGDGWVQGAKGVQGGAVRLVGAHPR